MVSESLSEKENRRQSNLIYNMFVEANKNNDLKKLKKLTKKYRLFLCNRYKYWNKFDCVRLPEALTLIDWKPESLKTMISVCPLIALSENTENSIFIGRYILDGKIENVKAILDTCPSLVTGRVNKKELKISNVVFQYGIGSNNPEMLKLIFDHLDASDAHLIPKLINDRSFGKIKDKTNLTLDVCKNYLRKMEKEGKLESKQILNIINDIGYLLYEKAKPENNKASRLDTFKMNNTAKTL